MTFKDLENLIIIFYRKSFDFPMAIKIFGPIKNSTLPHRLVLAPLDPRFEFIFLEKFILPDGTQFLAGISLRQKVPIEVDFKQLEGIFGLAVQMPRLKPSQPVSHQFTVKNFDYPGSLILGVQPGHNEALRPVTDVILRRYYPGT